MIQQHNGTPSPFQVTRLEQKFLVQKLKVFINKITEKISGWFGQKASPEADDATEV
jgi:hypothetical protein